MSNRDRNNRKSGISDANRHNKYNNHTNKWKNNNWGGRNFNNYRNTDYGHSDNRYNSWNQTLPNLWDADWYNSSQQHPNFANNHYNANNFNNVAPGPGANFSRPSRVKNLKEKPDRAGDRNNTAKGPSEPDKPAAAPNSKKGGNKETPSTVTSSTSVQQPCSSNSIEKPSPPPPPSISSSSSTASTVADANNSSKQQQQQQQQQQQNERSAEQVTKKLIHELTSMNKHNLKHMINNPSSKYETALQTHARNRMRAEMRSKLQNMSSNHENQLVNNVLETEESIDMDRIPDNVFDEIGRVLDINLLGQEDNSNQKYDDNDPGDKDKEQIAYPEDLFLRAEKLLMENSIIFLEDRENDSMLNSDRLEDDRTPVKIKNEIKEEPDDITDDHFFEIQESVNDSFSLSDLVFEDRDGAIMRNDAFVDDLNDISDKEDTPMENLDQHHSRDGITDDSRDEVDRSLLPKDQLTELDRYRQTTNNNVKDISSRSPKLPKTPEKQRTSLAGSKTSDQKSITGDDFRTVVTTVKQEFNRDGNDITSSGTHLDRINPLALGAATQEPPKKTDLFTKLQNSGAFEPNSVKRRVDTMLDSPDYKREYSRKKKKKHKSRSRSISRQRSRSRSPSRSRNSRRSKKASRDRYRRRDTSQHNAIGDNVNDERSAHKVANVEFSNDSSMNPSDVNDESSNKFVENIRPMEVDNVDKTEQSSTSNQAIHDVCADELMNRKTAIETQLGITVASATNGVDVTTLLQPILDIHNGSQSTTSSRDLIDSNGGIDSGFVSFDKVIDHPEESQLSEISDIGSIPEVMSDGVVVPDSLEDTTSQKIEEIVQETVEEIIQVTVEEIVQIAVGEIVQETIANMVRDTVEQTIDPLVDPLVDALVDPLIDPLADEAAHTEEANTIAETVEDTTGESVVSEPPAVEAMFEIVEIVADKHIDMLPLVDPTTLIDGTTDSKLPELVLEAATKIIVEESVGLMTAEDSSASNSEKQLPAADDPAESKLNQLQKNNIVAITKFILKPSTSTSRHQKSSSKHKCEKERHSSSSHKAKKSETNSQSSKKTDHKQDNPMNATPLTKHSNNEQPHRVWRSAGEKKCIEPSSKSTLRSIDIFDPTRSVKGIEAIKLPVEPAPKAPKLIEPVKVTEPPRSESKSSSPRKERAKSQSRQTTMAATTVAKSSTAIVPSRVDGKKGSALVKKGTTVAIKEKINPLHRQNVNDGTTTTTTSSRAIAEDATVNHSIAPPVVPTVTDPLKIMMENSVALQRMKDIDLKIMDLQMKKTVIDEQIHNLNKDKSAIDQTTIQLQNERFMLLSSLITKNTVPVSPKKLCDAPRDIPKDMPKDTTRDIPKDIPKDETKDMPKAVAKDVPRAITKDVPKAVIKDVPKTAIKDLPKDTPKAVPKDTPRAAIKDVPKEAPKAVIKDLPKEAPKAAIKDLPKEAPKAAMKDMPKDVPKTVTKEVPRDTIKDAPKDIPKDMPKAIIKDIVKDVPQTIEIPSSDDDVVVVTTTTKRIMSKKSNVPHNHSKRKIIDEDVKPDGADGAKFKKLKINLNALKPVTNNRNSAKNIADADDVPSDLKTNLFKSNRRCSVRLTKLSTEKIKLLIGIAGTEFDQGSDISGQLKFKDNVNNMHQMMFDGNFSGHRLPIVHLQVTDSFLIAASEDSNLYLHDLATGKLLGTFTEHTKTVTNFIVTEGNCVYSVSLDGSLKKLSIQNFDAQLLSINVGEALQVMDYSWDTAFIGSRSGKIYIFDTKSDLLAEECLCSVGKSIMALKATKEGPRKILIASSRCHNISVRDAITGLLLRTIEVPDKLTIYSILLDGGQLYCGTNKNLVFRYEFTSGTEISRIKLGTGTICLKSYKNSLILGGCYDGYIYAYNTKTETQLSRFPGPGKMLLHFDVFKDNIIAAAKDKSLCVLEVPQDIVSHE